MLNLAELKEKLPRYHHEHNVIADTFEGKLVVCHRCRRCNYVSCQEEVFTDLPLAFPQSCAGVDRETTGKPSTTVDNSDTNPPATERSLKGGDVGQRPTVSSIAHSTQGENVTSNEAEASSSASNYPVSTSNSTLQGKLSNIGIGADDPSISLEEMLGYFFEPEILEGSNQYFCEQCQSLQDAERSVVISKAPNFLVLTLKRFSYNVETQRRSKILQNVTYPLRLKLSNIRIKDQPMKREVRFDTSEGSSLSEERQTTTEERERIDAPPSKCTKQDTECAGAHGAHYSPSSSPVRKNPSSYIIDRFPTEIMYALTSVIVHSGVSSESGHYYCYARPSRLVDHDEGTHGEATKTHSNQSWCLFNDSRVSYASYESFSDIAKRFPKDTPYVLIYKNLSSTNDMVRSGDPDEEITQTFMDAVNYDNIQYLKVTVLYFYINV